MKRVTLIVLALTAAVLVGCNDAQRDRAEADRLEAEADLIDSETQQQVQQAVAQSVAIAQANAESAQAAAEEADSRASYERARADRVSAEYHELVIESIRRRNRPVWPWVVVSIVSIVAAGVVVWFARRPVQVVVIPPQFDGPDWVALPESTRSDLVPAVLRPQRRSIRRVRGSGSNG